MASLDLGTLVAHIKVDGAATAQSTLKGVSSALGQTGTAGIGATTGVGSFTSALTSGLGNINLFGTNLGTLAASFGCSEAAGVAMGTAIGGVVVAGIMAGVAAVKELANACVEFVKSSMEVGTGFQKQMSVVQAISGSTGTELNALTDAARDFGKNTVFSATEAAQAMEYTSLAGWNAQETIKGLPGILNLAASSNMDLAKASDIVTDYLTAFNMKIEDSTKLADIMAYAMSNTNTNTLQLGEAYKSCAATCTAFGVSVEEGTAWLGQLANAGIKGGEAGTALNAVLARLYGETKTTNDAMQQYGLSMYDANGKAKNFTKVMGEMQKAMKKMSDEEKNVFLKQVAGVNHLSDFATMVQVAAEDVDGFTKELENCAGTSENMAKTMTDNIAGIQKSIESKVESIKLSIFTAFEPLATSILKIFETIVNALATFLEPIGNIVGSVLGLITPIVSCVTEVVNAIVDKLGEFIDPFSDTITEVFDILASVLNSVKDVVVNVVTGILDLLDPFLTLVSGTLQAFIALVTGDFEKFDQTIAKMAEGIVNTLLIIPNGLIFVVNKAIDVLNMIPGVAIEPINELKVNFTDAIDEMADNTEEIGDTFAEQAEEFPTTWDEAFKQIMELTDERYNDLVDRAKTFNYEMEHINDAYAKYKSQLMNDEEKRLRELYEKNGMDALQKEKLIQKELALYEESIDKKIEADREYEVGWMLASIERQKTLIDEKATVEGLSKVESAIAKLFKDTNLSVISDNKTILDSYQYIVDKKREAAGISVSDRGGSGKKFANGTISVPSTGSYLVGEFGPEIVTLPQSASVTPNHSTVVNDNSEVVGAIQELKATVASMGAFIDNIAWQQKNLNQAWG